MQVAVTGATGFLGRYIVNLLTETGRSCRCWSREDSDRGGFDHDSRIEWIPGHLGDPAAADDLVRGVDAVVHSALHREGAGFRGAEGDLVTFVETNVVGTIRLIEAARRAGVERFIFIATCAVHEVILDDRALDEAHPLWPTSHYGAHKAAIEKFVHSYGLGQRYPICSLRPTGIYGLARPADTSRWYDIVVRVAGGEDFSSRRGGKEVHAADVARAVDILLQADASVIAGQAYNCYDMYVAEQDVAGIAKDLTGSGSRIDALNKGPKHQIDTRKLQALGMEFGGRARLEHTIRELVDAVGA
jgi:nucleoside-diphosphate-sugar epimerase